MGYTFSLVGASHLSVEQMDKELRSALYNSYGDGGYVNSKSIFSFDFQTNRVLKKTDKTQEAGFGYSGSWGAGTVENFWIELERYALSNGLMYTVPIFMGTSGAIDMQDCATYAEEIQLIKKEFLTRPPQWSNNHYREWINDLEQAFLLGASYGAVAWECD